MKRRLKRWLYVCVFSSATWVAAWSAGAGPDVENSDSTCCVLLALSVMIFRLYLLGNTGIFPPNCFVSSLGKTGLVTTDSY